MKCPVDIEKLYNDYIKVKYKENSEERYEGKGEYYHASSSGSCSRKNYFSSVEQIKTTNEVKPISNRVMRLGTIVHEDLQESLLTIYSNTIDSSTVDSNTEYSKEKEIPYFQKEILNDRFDFHIEKEIILKDLNVRGFYDLVAVSQHDGSVYLIDFKTMGTYPWSRKFGRKYFDPNPSQKYPLQLATYGLAIREEFGRLDGMFLYYYNKDNSMMKAEEVSMHYLAKAKNYWTNINREHEKGLPMFSEGLSPVESWECKYCNFLDHCKPPFFNKK
tara:strand:+ start:2790 stop:3611 length:822 start_codon:yes stop_codon:yes gene_type:complete